MKCSEQKQRVREFGEVYCNEKTTFINYGVFVTLSYLC